MALTLQSAEQQLREWNAEAQKVPKAKYYCTKHNRLELSPCTGFRGYTVEQRYHDLNALVGWLKAAGE